MTSTKVDEAIAILKQAIADYGYLKHLSLTIHLVRPTR